MRTASRTPVEGLRTAIDCLPVETRLAMLRGVERNKIIVGAYTDNRGGVCPMLAAHRCGGRTSFAGFARAWDRFARPHKRPRKATEEELRGLRAMLEQSLARDDALPERSLDRHDRALSSSPPPADTGDRNRTPELARKPGWAWLRIFRRYDEYQAAVAPHLEQVGRIGDDESSDARASMLIGT